MLKNRDVVFEKAEEMAEKYRQKLLAEAEGREIPEEITGETTGEDKSTMEDIPSASDVDEIQEEVVETTDISEE